jgi:branched-chain amino acid transport system substrate-binding protein
VVKIFALLILAIAVCSCDSCNSKGEATCQILLLSPRSGAQAGIGEQISRAREIVEKEARGTPRERIRIVEVDTGGRPEQARAVVDRYLSEPKTPLVVGSILSSETREFLQSALAKGATILANGSSDPEIRSLPFRKEHDRFFRNWPADDREGAAMAAYLVRSHRASRLALLHANDAYARALASAFQRRFEELGGKIIEVVPYPASTTAFDALIDRFTGANPDGFYIVGFPPDLAGFYNTLRRRPDTRNMPMFSAVGVESGDFASLAVAPIDNLFFTSPAVDESSPAFFEFRQIYREQYGDSPPDIVAAITYDALEIAMRTVGATSCDATTIADRLYSMDPFPGASGPTGFDAMGDVVTKASAIKYYEKGQLRLEEKNGM